MSDDSEKTEDPTDKKLADAREEGNLAKSQEVGHWFTILAALMFVGLMGEGMARDVLRIFEDFIEHPDLMTSGPGGIEDIIAASVTQVFFLLLLPFILFMVAGLSSNLLQNGINFSPKALKIKFDKLSLIAGVKRLFSLQQILEFVKGLVKIAVITVILLFAVVPEFADIELMMTMAPTAMIARIYDLTILVLALTLFIMTVIAAADYAFQKWNYLQKQKMSKQEVKDEGRQAEGDPLVKGRLRQIRMERARKRMMASVPDATVVVTNPTHFSVALKYDRENMPAPVVVAKGHDDLALRIREVAKENNVPLVENPPVARALYAAVDVDEEIKPEHFQAVAEIITYVMKLNNAQPTRH